MLEDRERAGQRRLETHEPVARRIEHRGKPPEELLLAAGVGAREREKGRRAVEGLLERPVGHVQHIPRRRHRSQHPLEHLEAEVGGELPVASAGDEGERRVGRAEVEVGWPLRCSRDACGDGVGVE